LRKLVAVIALLVLTACGWDHDLNAGLDGLVGHPQNHALNRLGPIVGERWVANEKLYVWGERQTAPHERIVAGASEVSGAPIVDQIAAQGVTSLTWGCYIRIFTDANGIIQRYDWMGNRQDCELYIERLKRWPE